MSRNCRKKNNRTRKNVLPTESRFNGKIDDGQSETSVFEIKVSKTMGRYMVSKRMFKPGEIILNEDPLVVGPCVDGKVQCLGCYKVLESEGTLDYVKCSNCNWPLCSPNCSGINKQHGHTQTECTILEKIKSSTFLTYNNVEDLKLNYAAIVPLRCLILKIVNPQKFAIIKEMEDHSKIRKKIRHVWENNQILVVDKIIKEWGLKEFNEEEIHQICGILEINCFEIRQQGVNIRGLYPNACMMSHNCVPNTNHSDEKNFTLTVRASVNISVDEPITLSYAYTFQGTQPRREHLLENKFFECKCERCSDPSELGTFTSALICPKCKTKNGFVLPEDLLNADSCWVCSQNDYNISAKSVKLLISRVTKEIDSIDCNDINAMETLLQKYRNVLHPNHYLFLSVKLSLSQLYGKICGFLIYELDDDLLQRKRDICGEILRIFDVIEPGFTKIRGVTLYELHAPLMIQLSREFQSGELGKNEVRSQLKVVMKCLEEASVILSFESETSAEGTMGLAAKDALLKIKDWEKIVGKI